MLQKDSGGALWSMVCKTPASEAAGKWTTNSDSWACVVKSSEEDFIQEDKGCVV